MKKLIKLQINSEKIMQNEELLSLKGGEIHCCWCWYCDNYGWFLGPGDPVQCSAACYEIGCMSTWSVNCYPY